MNNINNNRIIQTGIITRCTINQNHYFRPTIKTITMSTDNKNYERKADVDRLQTPFEHIALAFSGGGFRAASFGLGTLSFLNEVPFGNSNQTLLQKVTYISSASGGTIPASLYALHSVQGKSFGEFYKHLSENLEGTCLLEEAMQMLNDKKAWKDRPEKTQNIINSFAMAYDKYLYKHASVETLKENPENTHLEEVCFNATELYRGLLFRQNVQLKPDPTKDGQPDEYLYGNFIVNLDHSASARLRIADLLAASSCFPAGFEPIVFPKDFIAPGAERRFLLDHLKIRPQELSWTELDVLYKKEDVNRVHKNLPKPFNAEQFARELEKVRLKEELNICLMDGGITDNQGLESIIQANDRRIKDKSGFKQFDLMMICDVGSHYMDAYQLPKLGKTSWMSIHRVRILCSILFVLAGVGTWAIWKFCPHTAWWNLLSLLTGMVSFGALAIVWIIQYIKTYASGKVDGGAGLDLDKSFSPQIVRLLFKYFKGVRFNLLSFMVKERITSVLSLNNDVFLKRIRYLLYNEFFEQNDMKSTGRVKANHIYDLTFTNDDNRLLYYSFQYQPSREMQIVAEAAFNMATTLWFSQEDVKNNSMAAVIACGQFTTCFNLLDYIEKMKKHYPGSPSSIYEQLPPEGQELVNEIEVGLKVQWSRFREDPFWLYKNLR
jgi:hypothetical protein